MNTKKLVTGINAKKGQRITTEWGTTFTVARTENRQDEYGTKQWLVYGLNAEDGSEHGPYMSDEYTIIPISFTKKDFTEGLAGMASAYTTYWRDTPLGWSDDRTYMALVRYAEHLLGPDAPEVSDNFTRFAKEITEAHLTEDYGLPAEYACVNIDAAIIDCAVQHQLFGHQKYA